MAWRQTGDKPLSESMMVSLPTHICVTRPQWVNSLDLGDVTVILKLEHLNSLYRIIVVCTFTVKLLPGEYRRNSLMRCQATSHYLSQCSSRSMSPYGVTLNHNENNIQTEMKWPIFRRRRLEIRFLQWAGSTFDPLWWEPPVTDIFPRQRASIQLDFLHKRLVISNFGVFFVVIEL